MKSAIGLSAAFQISAVILTIGAGLLWLVPIGRVTPHTHASPAPQK
jgi:hypothetical protein